MWASKPTIIIKRISEGKYTWLLYLSNNRKRPTCVSPTTYEELFKCRARAKEFAYKFKGPLRLISKSEGTDEVLVIDETKMINEIEQDEIQD